MNDNETLLESVDFATAEQLLERLTEWITDPNHGPMYLEDGRGEIITHACLLEKVLSDQSVVHNIRLS